MIEIFRANGIRGWRRRYPLLGRPDFVFLDKRVAVFVDGCFWHGHPTKCRLPLTNREYWRRKIAGNAARDRKITRLLSRKGWKVIRIWENAIRRPMVVRRLKRALQ